jgi:hypothetical protein
MISKATTKHWREKRIEELGRLSMRLGIALSRTNEASVNALCSQDPAWELSGDGGGGNIASLGVLYWPKSTIASLSRAKFGKTLQEKPLRMAGYLFELVYDLMIAPRDNASQSPGFEACGVALVAK